MTGKKIIPLGEGEGAVYEGRRPKTNTTSRTKRLCRRHVKVSGGFVELPSPSPKSKGARFK
jgi:hypothetical protein